MASLEPAEPAEPAEFVEPVEDVEAVESEEEGEDAQTVRSRNAFSPPTRQHTYETYQTVETAELPPATIQQTRTVGSTIRRKQKKGFVGQTKHLWTKYGPDLDVPTVLMMGKGALPPTIAISMYQG